MKTHSAFFLGLGLLAAVSLAPVTAQEAPPAAATDSARLTPDQLDELLGPIALYPDALIALILPAAATPSDVVLAARYLQGGGDPAQIENQPWDDSVVALAHYADVIQWMDQNLAWTKQLGEVFVAQPTDVMQAVQRLRAEARAAGTLTDTPQQQVVMEDQDISIVPTQPDVIYVPRYDPEVVYDVQPPGYYPGPFLTFGTGFSTGLWLTYDMDWGHRRIWVIDRHDRHYDWRDHRDWRHPVFPGRPGYVSDPSRHPWNPPAHPATRPSASNRIPPQVVRPAFIPGTPPRPPGWHRNDLPNRRPENPRAQTPPASANPRPGQFQSPVQPLQGPLVQPLQQPVVQPSRPPQNPSAPPDRRGNPDPRDRTRDDRQNRGREAPATGALPPRTIAPPPPHAAVQPPVSHSQGFLPRLQPPAPPAPPKPPPPPPPPAQSSEDDKRRDRDRHD